MSNTITAMVTSEYFKNTDAEVDEREAGTLETEAKVERKPEHRSTRLSSSWCPRSATTPSVQYVRTISCS